MGRVSWSWEADLKEGKLDRFRAHVVAPWNAVSAADENTLMNNGLSMKPCLRSRSTNNSPQLKPRSPSSWTTTAGVSWTIILNRLPCMYPAIMEKIWIFFVSMVRSSCSIYSCRSFAEKNGES